MGNARTRTIHYKPRMTQWEALERLDPRVREALQTSVTDWDAYAVLRFQQKNTVWQTLEWLKEANVKEAARPWWRGFPSPTATLGMAPLRGNYQ